MRKRWIWLLIPLAVCLMVLYDRHSIYAERVTKENADFQRIFAPTDRVLFQEVIKASPVTTSRTLCTLKGAEAAEFVRSLRFEPSRTFRTGHENSLVAITFFAGATKIDRGLIWTGGEEFSFEKSEFRFLSHFQPETQQMLEEMLHLSNIKGSVDAGKLVT